jgi:hypothetical protein
MADRWTPRQLHNSRYVWLPLILKPDLSDKADGTFTLKWKDKWNLSIFEETDTAR